MSIFLYVWASTTSLIVLFYLFDFIIGEYVSDKNRFKKWWKKNIVDCDPDEKYFNQKFSL